MIDFTRALIRDDETRYRYDERLAIMIEDSEPTREQKEMALKWAKERV